MTEPTEARRDLVIKKVVVEDDGSDGFFWRNGERWLRERGEETPLIELAPNLEAMARMTPQYERTLEMIKEYEATRAAKQFKEI